MEPGATTKRPLKHIEADSFAPVISGPTSSDDAQLARIGKTPVLRRNFGFLTIVGFSCSVLITWEGSMIVFLAGLENGGPSGIIYGFLIIWLGTLSVFATLSELVSMAPTSGGQYHWVSMLAPPSARNMFGYIVGWLEITGWQALVASGGLVTGTMIQGVILLTHPTYAENMQNWHGTLLFWAVILLSYGINTALGSLLAKFEGFILVLHILGFFAVIFPLTLLETQHASPSEVFDHWLNLGGWQSQGLSMVIGLQGSVFAFLGADAAIHMSEEIRDIDAALAENPHYPFMAIFRQAAGSRAGAAVMASIVIVMAFSATTGCLASTSRVYWAFARDRGLPGWNILRQVSPRTKIPRYAVLTTTFVAIILSIVNIGNETAFHGVVSVSIAGLFGSYLFAATLLLYRRVTGGIRRLDANDELTNTVGKSITWGPWRLRGLFGVANNIFSCAYLSFIFFFSFWPSHRDVSPQNMNWAALVFVVVLIFSAAYYVFWARKVYRGPIIERPTGLIQPVVESMGY
ncbi:hypothetical protein DL771_006343 [Monosporascus sp. 5C6A]|nr:hypothetical protein DL771_006343 [Monosporascus sp. 5C6A]